MWNISKNAFLQGDRENIWKVLSDVSDWHTWNAECEGSSCLVGSVSPGSTGSFEESLVHRKVQFELGDIIQDSYFDYLTHLNGATINSYWILTDTLCGIHVEQGFVVSGWLSNYYKWVLHDKCQCILETSLANLQKKTSI